MLQLSGLCANAGWISLGEIWDKVLLVYSRMPRQSAKASRTDETWMHQKARLDRTFEEQFKLRSIQELAALLYSMGYARVRLYETHKRFVVVALQGVAPRPSECRIKVQSLRLPASAVDT
jgi:hypothetical protein